MSRSLAYWMIIGLAMAGCGLAQAPDAAEQRRMYELCTACESGELKTVQKLLKEGADPNGESRDYGTKPFHAAIYRGHGEVVRLMI